MKQSKITSRNKNVKLVGYYKIPEREDVFKILRLEWNNQEYFWLYRGTCLCHTRQHEGSKKPFCPHINQRVIYNKNNVVIGEVVSEAASSWTPIQFAFKDKTYRLDLIDLNKNTTTVYELG